MLDGYFGVASQEIFFYHRNLNGIYTDVFGLLRKKSLEEILFKMLPTARNQSSEFKRILDGK